MARGRDLFFETLKALGVEYLFGNPGTTELPLIDGCTVHPEVKYVTALHEGIAVAMAMGYARASGRVGVANLHVAPGLAHGLSNLYNAHRAGIPLVVTAGQQDTRLTALDPILTADLVEMARPFTKWAYEVRHIDEWPVVLQRAFKIALAPPAGPVFLSLPADVMLAETEARALPVTRVGAAVLGDEQELRRAAELLATARNPVIVAGDGVGLSGAWDELVALSEALGASVYTEPLSTLANFPNGHPHWAGQLASSPGPMRATFTGVDVAFLCGFTTQAPVAFHDGGGPLIPPEVQCIFLHDNPWEIGKNQYGAAAILGQVKRSLGRLVEILAGMEKGEVAARIQAARERGARRREDWQRQLDAVREQTPIAPVFVAAELGTLIPPEGVLVSETVSNTPPFVNLVPTRDPLGYWAGKGGGLGHAASAALGYRLGAPNRPVVSVVGDGAFLYYPQVLWTAVNAGVPVLYVVLNNTSYRILKQGLKGMGGPWGPEGSYPPGLDITGPDVDFAAMARSYGMEGERVTDPGALRGALERGLAAGRPYLLDVVIDKRI